MANLSFVRVHVFAMHHDILEEILSKILTVFLVRSYGYNRYLKVQRSGQTSTMFFFAMKCSIYMAYPNFLRKNFSSKSFIVDIPKSIANRDKFVHFFKLHFKC